MFATARRSRVYRLVTRVAACVRVGTTRSRLFALLPIGSGSRDFGDRSRLRHQFVRAVDGSTAGRLVRRTDVAARLTAAAGNARLARLGTRLHAYVAASFCYRWLTSEPDPDVVVIDLRETWSVGPALAVLERTVRALIPGVATSHLGDVTRTVAAAVRARPIRVASLVLLGTLAASVSLAAVFGTLTLPFAVLASLGATAAIAGLRSRMRLEDLCETRLVQILRAAFEPPAPPERVEREPTGPTDEEVDDRRNG